MRILAIDPGTTKSAYLISEFQKTDKNPKIIQFAKIDNYELRKVVTNFCFNADFGSNKNSVVVIERVAGMGMAVGSEVFRTCEWIGRIAEIAYQYNVKTAYVFRNEEKQTLCGTAKANDTTIRRALIDKYATFDFKTGKGTKKNPDTLYGMSADCWSALAVTDTFCKQLKHDGWYSPEKQLLRWVNHHG